MSSEWVKQTLGDFVRLQRGHDLTASEQQPGVVPIMGSAGQNGTHNQALAEGPGVVIGRSGASAGRVHFSEVDYWPHNTCLYVTDFLGNNPRFTYYLLQTIDLAALNSGSAQPSLNRNYLYSIPIQVPQRSEQDSIVKVLQALDDRITLLRETNATLEAIAQALFKSWFVDFDPVRAKQQGRTPEGMDEATAALFPDSFEESELGLVPKGWRIGTIGDFADVIDCLHAKKPELHLTGRPFLQLNNIRDDGLLDTSKLSFVSDIDYNKWISRIEVSEGDCVITNVGRVGAVAQIPDSFRAAMGRNMTAIRMKADWPYPTFLLELLQSPVMRSEIDRRTDIGTILNALNVRNIPLLRCVLPPKAVMSEFEGVCRPLRAAMEANLDRANSLATLRDTLLPRLISGQLRLPEAEALIEEIV